MSEPETAPEPMPNDRETLPAATSSAVDDEAGQEPASDPKHEAILANLADLQTQLKKLQQSQPRDVHTLLKELKQVKAIVQAEPPELPAPPTPKWMPFATLGTVVVVGLATLVLGLLIGDQSSRLAKVNAAVEEASRRQDELDIVTRKDLPQLAKSVDVVGIKADVTALRYAEPNRPTKQDLEPLVRGNELNALTQTVSELSSKIKPSSADPAVVDKLQVQLKTSTNQVKADRMKLEAVQKNLVEAQKKVTSLEAAIKARPATSAAPPALADVPLDVAIVFCQGRLDSNKLSDSLREAVELLRPDARLLIAVARNEDLEIVRKLAPRGNGPDTLAKDLQKVQEPKGAERPGAIVEELRVKHQVAPRAVVVIATPGAEVPDPAQWGDARPYVVFAPFPGAQIDSQKLQRWAQFCTERQGAVAIVPFGKEDKDGYKALDRGLRLQFQKIFLDLQRASK